MSGHHLMCPGKPLAAKGEQAMESEAGRCEAGDGDDGADDGDHGPLRRSIMVAIAAPIQHRLPMKARIAVAMVSADGASVNTTMAAMMAASAESTAAIRLRTSDKVTQPSP